MGVLSGTIGASDSCSSLRFESFWFVPLVELVWFEFPSAFTDVGWVRRRGLEAPGAEERVVIVDKPSAPQLPVIDDNGNHDRCDNAES